MNVRRFGSRQRLLLSGCLVVVCTGVALGLFLSAYASLATSTFRDRTQAYAQAFAANVGSWLDRGQTDVAETLADFLVTGSVLGVEILDASGRPIVRSGVELPAAPAVGGAEETWGEANGATSLLLDVTMPRGTGRLRMVVDASSTEASIREAIWGSAAGGVAFDGAVLGLLAWALRGRRKPTQATETDVPVPDPGRIVVGELVIDRSRCEASYAGRPLRLTPKQFALLCVLASEPGRVFSEPEILAAAWPDSPYADARDIKQYVYLLRRRMAEVRPEGRDVIVTVPGFGYRLADGR